MAETDSRINIIYASNDGYAGHLAASLCSLLDHNRRAEHIDIYVLSVGMCTEYQNRLKSLLWAEPERSGAGKFKGAFSL